MARRPTLVHAHAKPNSRHSVGLRHFYRPPTLNRAVVVAAYPLAHCHRAATATEPCQPLVGQTFLTGHFFVAPVPRWANLCLHVLLQLHLRHVFLHWASHLASLPAPIGTVGYGTCLLVVMAHAGSARAKATVKTLIDNLFMMFRFCEVSVRQGWIVG